MKIVLFYHSLISDWNHGNAHFLRGVATDLIERGHQVEIYEPADAWSAQSLVAEHGPEAVGAFHAAYPRLKSHRYDAATLDLEEALDGAELAVVHEWSAHELVARIGKHRNRRRDYRLLFHDTHHRAITAREQMAGYDLSHYDGVLAYGAVLRDLYLQENWTQRAWVWHEAADVRVFHPMAEVERVRDLVWIGNWGDDERTAELHEFLLDPVKALGLTARVHGVRYPEDAQRALAAAGIEYAGWLANFRAPRAFAEARLTVHVPRRPYVKCLRGIPTIRPFEALACGIPLISAPWEDAEELFRHGRDFLFAHDGKEMREQMQAVLHDPLLASALAANGLETILARHTCAHRVDQLLAIHQQLNHA